MGIRLIVEVLDHWQDFGLTAGERGDLIVIAEHTSDETRETVVSIHKPYILKRAGKSAAGWKNAIGKLMKKGVLQHVVKNGRRVTGHENQVAQYHIPHLCPAQSHDGLWGQCNRSERVTSQMTHSADESSREGHLTDDPLAQEGHLTGVSGSPDRCQEGHLTGDPIPSSLPQGPSSLSVAEQVVLAAGVVAEDERESFIRWIKTKHKPQGPAWWRRVASNNGDLRELADAWRADSPQLRAAAAKCGECDEHGFRYHDPITQMRPYRCPCRTQGTAA